MASSTVSVEYADSLARLRAGAAEKISPRETAWYEYRTDLFCWHGYVLCVAGAHDRGVVANHLTAEQVAEVRSLCEHQWANVNIATNDGECLICGLPYNQRPHAALLLGLRTGPGRTPTMTTTTLRGLSNDERDIIKHIGRWGSSGYPLRRIGRRWSWSWGPYERIGGHLFRTKREAVASFEAYHQILLDALAGRL